MRKILLGWVGSGKYELKPSPRLQMCKLTMSNEGQNLVNLNNIFWELEQVPDYVKFSEEQLMCERHFENTTRRIILYFINLTSGFLSRQI